MLERVCVPGMTVLDVGAADGNKSALLPKGVRYVGLDPRPVMPPQTTPGGTLLQGVGEALPFRNGAFDVVLSIAALDCHNDAGTSVAEWARVLRPGGAVAVQLSVLTPRAARAANALTRLGRLLLAVAALPEVGPLGVGDLMYGSLVNRGRLKAHNYACGELEALLTPYFTVEDRREQDHPSGAVLYLTARKPDRAADQTGDRGARCSGGRPARMWGPSRLP